MTAQDRWYVAQTQARKAQSTRVDFFTVAREAGDPDAGAEDA